LKQPDFFNVEKWIARLSRLDDQFEAFSRTEVFCTDLEMSLTCSDGRKGGHFLFDAVLVFKILKTGLTWRVTSAA